MLCSNLKKKKLIMHILVAHHSVTTDISKYLPNTYFLVGNYAMY